jgi:acetyltransferase-like isoleucine patch superfamily enzyme
MTAGERDELAVRVAKRPPSPAVFADRGWRWSAGWIKGWLVRPWWRLRALFGGSRIRVGRRFSLQGSLTARGPGEVVLGDDVVVLGSATPFTHSREARIEIGDRSLVNGTRFGCALSIRIGADALLGDARLFDTDHHPISRRRATDPTLRPSVRPIAIADNVWIGGGAAVAKGVSIGANSVVAFGSVVTADIPPNRIVGGNPARDIAEVPE